ncbi:MAG: hypothetical protein WD100_10630, partial [Tistlia sp.]
SLNRAYWRICDVFGVFPPRSVPVMLYTREQFRDVTRSPQFQGDEWSTFGSLALSFNVGF